VLLQKLHMLPSTELHLTDGSYQYMHVLQLEGLLLMQLLSPPNTPIDTPAAASCQDAPDHCSKCGC
jgi:hypothetical protein